MMNLFKDKFILVTFAFVLIAIVEILVTSSAVYTFWALVLFGVYQILLRVIHHIF
jgi:hypothetical protein